MALTSEKVAEIKAFVEERDEMLIAGDIDRMMEFDAKHNPGVRSFASHEVAEIALHKARTAAKSLPIELRLESKRWLSDRSYSSFDDGDLTQ